MENKNEVHMIYIKDLIFAALSRWKAALAVALILALLLGGVQMISGFSGIDATPSVNQEELVQYEKDKAELEQTLARTQSELASYQTYLSSAPLMQLNPYDHYEMRLSLYIQTDYKIQPGMSYQDPDQTPNILNAYAAVLRSSVALEAMAQVLETESQCVSEIISIDKSDSTLQMLVKLPTEETANTLLPILVTQATAARSQIATTVAEHTLSVTEQAVSPTADAYVSELQAKHTSRLTALKETLVATEDALAKLKAPGALTPVSKRSVVKKAVIFAVLGAVLGAFLTVCVVWVLHICSDKIYAAKNLTNRTGVKVIGTLGCEKKNPIDRVLYRLEGRAEPGLDNSPVLADIRCRAKDAKHLLITGSGTTADRQTLTDALCQAMPGVLVEDKGSILHDAAALEALAVCDAAVLVERCAVSRYSSVEKQLSAINDYGAKLLGCVLLEK